MRFAFGENWKSFLATLRPERIASAEGSLKGMLGCDTLKERTFLDLGCGSGLFSLAAARLSAKRIVSLDIDPESVACARELREQSALGPDWIVESGSALDTELPGKYGTFDIVYAWGVLHHTGCLWDAARVAGEMVTSGGLLYISVYNLQPRWSTVWIRIKEAYVNGGAFTRDALLGTIAGMFVVRGAAADFFALKNPFARYRRNARDRGMSVIHDWRDWVGGYPFEPATPEEVVTFYVERGFLLRRIRTVGAGRGCNEFLFVKVGNG